MLELKQEGIDDIGFIDPNTVNGHVVKHYAKDTEDLLENFLEALMNTKSTIIFPYNMG
jgi:hypothetical protein